MRPMAPVFSRPASFQVSPPSVDLKMPQPGEIVLRETPPRCPAHNLHRVARARSPARPCENAGLVVRNTGLSDVPALVVSRSRPPRRRRRTSSRGSGCRPRSKPGRPCGRPTLRPPESRRAGWNRWGGGLRGQRRQGRGRRARGRRNGPHRRRDMTASGMKWKGATATERNTAEGGRALVLRPVWSRALIARWLSRRRRALAAAHSLSLRLEELRQVSRSLNAGSVPGCPTVLRDTPDSPVRRGSAAGRARGAWGKGRGLNRRPHRTSPTYGASCTAAGLRFDSTSHHSRSDVTISHRDHGHEQQRHEGIQAVVEDQSRGIGVGRPASDAGMRQEPEPRIQREHLLPPRGHRHGHRARRAG